MRAAGARRTGPVEEPGRKAVEEAEMMNVDVENALVLAAQAAVDALRAGAPEDERDRARDALDRALRDLSVAAASSRQAGPEFEGPAYDPETDKDRLASQLGRIYDCMKDHAWRTLEEIHGRTGEPAASISAQLRHLRKPRFGAYRVEKRHRGDPSHGCFEYRVLPPDGRIEHEVADVPDLRGIPDEFRQAEIL
jgi:hypothetical protein